MRLGRNKLIPSDRINPGFKHTLCRKLLMGIETETTGD
ncbi:hypothetical protein FRUB_03587 [Fimbriiglobus ruber]|uniref:Uncharacterized protein n=1 Tax=Fimbriiglobus ruber TaxID=1908690 RepID=A0A225DZM4_9BACT|nr:hypothetical protein FRUB_03587 [Fimbriiglobus ruber]